MGWNPLFGLALAEQLRRSNAQLQEMEDRIMRLLILAAAATLVVTGTAMANNSARHDLYMKNLRDSGYNPASDRTAAGNMKTKPGDWGMSLPLVTLVHATCCGTHTHDRYMKNLRDSGYNNAASDRTAAGYYKTN
jgi:hypothetical protein